MASAARGQPRSTPRTDRRGEMPVNAPARARPTARAVRREQLSDEVAARLRAEIMTGALRPGTFIRLDETAAATGGQHHAGARGAAHAARGGHGQLEPHRGHRGGPAHPWRHRGHLLAAVDDRPGARGDGRPTDHRRRDRRAEPAERTNGPGGRTVASPTRSPWPNSRSTARSIGPAAGSSWRGSCCTPRATCHRSCSRPMNPGARRRSPATSS